MNEASLLSCYSKERISVVRDTILGMLSQAFPQEAASRLLFSYLEELNKLDAEIDRLHSVNAPPADISQACRVLLSKIAQLVPRLGVLQRSSSLRIAFELAKSVQTLATQLLHTDGLLANSQFNILCASEWHYSPLYYQKHDLLEEMILFGLPATESDNSLVYPIMAHEAGHAFWAYSKSKDNLRRLIDEKFRKIVFDYWDQLEGSGCTGGLSKPGAPVELQTNIFYSNLVTRLSGAAHRQAEETFCDYIGISTFGSSYLSAFAYLAAAGARGDYSDTYCSSATRSSLLICAANSLSIPIPTCFEVAFDTKSRVEAYPYSNPEVLGAIASASQPFFLVSILGELTVMEVASEILSFASAIGQSAGVVAPDVDRVARAKSYLSLSVPTPSDCTPQETLCAAWEVSDEQRAQMLAFATLEGKQKWIAFVSGNRVLKETVAKSLEINDLMAGVT